MAQNEDMARFGDGTTHFVSGFGFADSQADTFTADAGFTIRKAADLRYLQCLLNHPEQQGSLEAYHEGQMIDRADLIMGWQNAAVDSGCVPTGGDIQLRVTNQHGDQRNGFETRRIWLTSSWEKGHRKRLKCYVPFEDLNVFADRSVYPCCARQWLKTDTQAGHADQSTMQEIWNGDTYQRMRREFLDDNYAASCRPDRCPKLQSRPDDIPVWNDLNVITDATINAVNEGLTVLPTGPANMYHDIDFGCNLNCTMCRDCKILPNRPAIKAAVNDISKVIDMGGLSRIAFSGAGETLIMRDMIALMESDLFASNGVAIALTTNATNLDPAMWKRIGHNRFMIICVSADGCSDTVYGAIRQGGRWADVRKNLGMLADLKRKGAFGSFIWNYTVQRANISDVANAIVLARELGVDQLRLIAQLGSLARTGGNMFEEGDMDALSRLHDEIDSVGGFDDARILTSELQLRNHRYRTPAARLEMAEYVLDRMTTVDIAPPSILLLPDWQKCEALVAGAIESSRSGTWSGDALSNRHRAFLVRFADIAANRVAEPQAGLGFVRAMLKPSADRERESLGKAARELADSA